MPLAIQPEIKQKAVEFLRQELSPELKAVIRHDIKVEGSRWCIPHHFNWGMAVRDALRSQAGIADDQLPSGNWDDYYVECIEEAVLGEVTNG